MQTREQIQVLQKAGLESMAGMAEAVMRGVEQWARLDLQLLRDATHDGAEAMRASVFARDVPEWIRIQSDNPARAKTGGSGTMPGNRLQLPVPPGRNWPMP